MARNQDKTSQERQKNLSFDKNALLVQGISNKTDKLLTKCKQRALLRDQESDYNACFNPTIYKNGNSMHVLNHFFNSNLNEKKPMKELPSSQDEIAQLIYANQKEKQNII